MCDRGRIASGAGTLNPGGLWGPGWDSLPSISKRRTREGPVGGQIELWLAVGVLTTTCEALLTTHLLRSLVVDAAALLLR